MSASPTSAEKEQAIALFNAGRFGELEGRAHLLVQQYPDSGFAWKVLGVSLQVQGKDALTALQNTARLLPDDAGAHCNLGAALIDRGQFDRAADSCRRALAIDPEYAEAHCNLGIALQGLRQLDAAAASCRRALAINPDFAEAHNNLGNALQDLGQLDDAVASYRRALAVKPDYAGAYGNLGNALQSLGQREGAVLNYRRALAINPGFAEAHGNLGKVLRDLGQVDEAVASCRLALALDPNFTEAYNNLGNALRDLGQLDEAVASYRQALAINPDFAGAHGNLGTVLRDLGQLSEAVTSYRRALAINPDFAEAHNNLGNALRDLGQLDEAVASCRRALAINPDNAEAHNNLGNALRDLRQLDDAVASYRRALTIDANFAEAHNNLGNALRDLGRLDEAAASCRRALAIKPDYAEAHHNLGNALRDLGQIDEAVASCRRALAIDPDFARAYGNLLFCLSHNETVDAQTLFAEHCRFGEQFEAPLRANWPRHTNSRDPERRLQVGFVSGDLRDHALANFIEPVLAQLAANPKWSLHAYSNHIVEDAVTQRLRGYLPHWHPIADLSDHALAQKIGADNIDILFDLSGHTGKHRLLSFARKPAPVQVSWMGYPGTTGLRAMDYYLTDRFFLPDEPFASQFTEKLVYLPASATFMPTRDAPSVNVLPAMSSGYPTFGSFNHSRKISRTVVALWARLLRACPDSRMLLGGMPRDGKYGTLIEWFAQEEIARDRLSFHERSGMEAYLGLHHRVDICLDTFPYHGGTTTLHALWMGAPTLTLAGSTPAGRTGVAILSHVGLDAFVARDAGDFVRKGQYWACNLAKLSNIRTEMRERLKRSAMGQPVLVAEGLQRALRIMWRRWCDDLPPVAVDVGDHQMDFETYSRAISKQTVAR
ncbi:MAG: tetratricopeptide repeat protein [Betaproteobacteria bacterium]